MCLKGTKRTSAWLGVECRQALTGKMREIQFWRCEGGGGRELSYVFKGQQKVDKPRRWDGCSLPPVVSHQYVGYQVNTTNGHFTMTSYHILYVSSREFLCFFFKIFTYRA